MKSLKTRIFAILNTLIMLHITFCTWRMDIKNLNDFVHKRAVVECSQLDVDGRGGVTIIGPCKEPACTKFRSYNAPHPRCFRTVRIKKLHFTQIPCNSRFCPVLKTCGCVWPLIQKQENKKKKRSIRSEYIWWLESARDFLDIAILIEVHFAGPLGRRGVWALDAEHPITPGEPM